MDSGYLRGLLLKQKNCLMIEWEEVGLRKCVGSFESCGGNKTCGDLCFRKRTTSLQSSIFFLLSRFAHPRAVDVRCVVMSLSQPVRDVRTYAV